VAIQKRGIKKSMQNNTSWLAEFALKKEEVFW